MLEYFTKKLQRSLKQLFTCQMWNSQTTLTFGMHAGQKIQDIEPSYIAWLARQALTWDWEKRRYFCKKSASEAAFEALCYLKLNNKCVSCGETLVPIGRSRANGKNHDDWSWRLQHKQCWKEAEKEVNRDSESRLEHQSKRNKKLVSFLLNEDDVNL